MPERSTDGAVSILQITDTHLHAAADGRMRGVATHETLLAVLDHAQRDARWPVDLIVATGDIVQDESREGYERFRETLKPLGRPVLVIPGNHDDPQLMAELLDEDPFQFCGERRVDGWSLVLLSTFLGGEDSGRLGSARLAAFEAALEAHAGRHVLVFMHHHPLPIGSDWLDSVGLRDASEFLRIVDAHPGVRGVVCGHVHQASDRERNGVRFLSTPSTCAQFLPLSSTFALDDRPPGLRWISLRPDGRIETEVAWIDAVAR